MIFKIFEIIFPVVLIALIGYLYAKKEKISMDMPKKLILIYLFPY